MAEIFISYARVDVARAQALAHALGQEGWSVWWDREIPPGRTFDEVIETALAEARCVIVLWSRDSVRSEWVKSEASDAARRRILVPVLADKVTIPLEFRRIQSAALVDWRNPCANPDWAHLCQAVGTLVGAPPRPRATRGAEEAGDASGYFDWRSRRWSILSGGVALCLLTAAAALAWALMAERSEVAELPPSTALAAAEIATPPAAGQAIPRSAEPERPSRGAGLRASDSGRRVPRAAEAIAEPAPAVGGQLERGSDVRAAPLSETPLPVRERASPDTVAPALARPPSAPPSFDVAYTRGVFRETGRVTVAPDGLHYAESAGRSAFDALCDEVQRVRVLTRIVDPDQRMVEVHVRDQAHRFTAEGIEARNGLVAALSRACGTR